MSHSNESMKNKDDDDFIKGIIADSLAMDENAYLQRVDKILKFYRRFLGPVVTGVENIPEAPALFVANHSTLGGDTIVALPVVAEATGRAVRGMNDRAFYLHALGRKLSINSSSVMGHQEIGSALLEAGKDLNRTRRTLTILFYKSIGLPAVVCMTTQAQMENCWCGVWTAAALQSWRS